MNARASTDSRGLEAREIAVRRAGRRVLRAASLAVAPGEVVGLLGANGAGKSTFIEVASGLRTPDSGSVTVDGIPVGERRAAARVGLAAQDTAVYPALTATENLEAVAGLYGARRNAARRRVAEVLEMLGLTAQATTRADRLSGGQRRRLHAGMALIHRPSVLFLDEPTVGSDVESRRRIIDLVRALAAEGAAIVYTTHYLPELEEINARIALLHDGTIRSLGTVREVVDEWGSGRVALRLRNVEGVPLPPGWRRESDLLVCDARGGDLARVLATGIDELGAHAGEVVDVRVERSSLDVAYLRLREQAEATARHEEGDAHVAA